MTRRQLEISRPEIRPMERVDDFWSVTDAVDKADYGTFSSRDDAVKVAKQKSSDSDNRGIIVNSSLEHMVFREGGCVVYGMNIHKYIEHMKAED